MRVSLRRGWATSPEVITCDWPALVSFLKASANVPVANKDAAILWLPSATAQHPKIAHGPTPAAGQGFHTTGWEASDQDPEGLWAIALDFDDVPTERWVEALGLAKRMGPGLAHTTWGHFEAVRTERVRGRIITPLAVPVPLEAWPAVWASMAAAFASVGATVDPQCKNASRCYWVPSCRDGVPAWVDTW